MKSFQGKYVATLVIASILILSLQDGLNSLHTVLHLFPNPFHYHISYATHYHHDEHGHHHHHELADHYEISIEDSNISDHNASNDVDAKEEKQKATNLKTDLFYSTFTNWSSVTYIFNEEQIAFHYCESSSSFIFNPPVPPPKI
jgi:hypothetical protein